METWVVQARILSSIILILLQNRKKGKWKRGEREGERKSMFLFFSMRLSASSSPKGFSSLYKKGNIQAVQKPSRNTSLLRLKTSLILLHTQRQDNVQVADLLNKTHSDWVSIVLGHVDSCVTGHQRSDGRRPGIYTKSRSKKLEDQRIQKGREPNGLLSGLKVYVGGYMTGTTDIEMKRIVTLHGGRIMWAIICMYMLMRCLNYIRNSASGATHILTSQGLSAVKTHKYLYGSARNKAHVVTPQWVIDSIASGKKKSEGDYSVVKNTTQHTLEELGIQAGRAEETLEK